MKIAVVIPWKDVANCSYRRAAFEYVVGFHEHLWPVTVGLDGDPFTRARALNLAIAGLDEDTIVVHADAEAFVPSWNRYARAVDLAAEAPGLVIPHDRYLFLNEETSADVLMYRRAPSTLGPYDCDVHGPNSVSLVSVYSRKTWELAGGYDERFPLWGGEDAAFAYACEAFTAPTRRLTGDVVHLWHPRPESSVPGGPGYSDQFAILAEYRDAAAVGHEAVRDLVRSR